jgi:hypothetical protein
MYKLTFGGRSGRCHWLGSMHPRYYIAYCVYLRITSLTPSRHLAVMVLGNTYFANTGDSAFTMYPPIFFPFNVRPRSHVLSPGIYIGIGNDDGYAPYLGCEQGKRSFCSAVSQLYGHYGARVHLPADIANIPLSVCHFTHPQLNRWVPGICLLAPAPAYLTCP